MEKIEVIQGDENKEDAKNVKWEIAGAPVMAARQFQKRLALPRLAQFHLDQDFLLFDRQFSDFGFGEHVFNYSCFNNQSTIQSIQTIISPDRAAKIGTQNMSRGS